MHGPQFNRTLLQLLTIGCFSLCSCLQDYRFVRSFTTDGIAKSNAYYKWILCFFSSVLLSIVAVHLLSRTNCEIPRRINGIRGLTKSLINCSFNWVTLTWHSQSLFAQYRKVRIHRIYFCWKIYYIINNMVE